MISVEVFADAVRRMATVSGAEVVVSDYYVRERNPYRYATVSVLTANHEAPARAAEMVALAISIAGHVAIHTHYEIHGAGACQMSVSLSRDLEPDEIRETPVHALPVALETFDAAAPGLAGRTT